MAWARGTLLQSCKKAARMLLSYTESNHAGERSNSFGDLKIKALRVKPQVPGCILEVLDSTYDGKQAAKSLP